jgi:hypothetical protein
VHTASPPLARAAGVWLVGLALVLTSFVAAPGASAAETCSTTPDDPSAPTYTVTVCVSVPDGPLSGDVPVAAQVYVTPVTTPTPPGVARVVFRHDGEYLLTDFDPEYGMTWRTRRMADATGTLEVRARTRDGLVAPVSVPVTLANGLSAPQPPAAEPFRVRTGSAPAPGARFRLVAVGDGVDGSTREEEVVEQVASWSPNLLAYLGDVYQRGSAFEFDTWYGSPTGYGRFRDITNPVVGNHEYQTPGATGYFGYWGGVPHYYSYDVAGWHLVALDSTKRFGQLRPGTAQYDWLAADLAANRARCTLVYMHHPRYSVEPGKGRGELAEIWRLLAARRVTLAVAGHTHAYARSHPLGATGAADVRGVTQLVAGAGGREIKLAASVDPRHASYLPARGALRLDLGSDDVEFAYVGADGTVHDAGAIGCKSTGDPLPPTVPDGLGVAPASSTTALVSWRPSTDQYTEVGGYTVRRNGVVVATLDASTTSYTDTGLVAGKTYSWTVSAFDTSDNHSEQSAPVAATMPAESAVQVSSRTLLRSVPVRAERNRGFARSKFRTWLDADGDGCTTRGEVLLAEAVTPPMVRPSCRISSGRWQSRLDGVRTSSLSRLGVEHLVPLREAWASGARTWAAVSRAQLANDLGYRYAVNVSTKRVLSARGSSEPQRWLPPRRVARCTYVAQWVAVKWRWRLSADRAEKRFLTRRLSACGWPRVEQPTRPAITRR